MDVSICTFIQKLCHIIDLDVNALSVGIRRISQRSVPEDRAERSSGADPGSVIDAARRGVATPRPVESRRARLAEPHQAPARRAEIPLGLGEPIHGTHSERRGRAA